MCTATERSGSRPRLLTTHAGDIQLAIPKLRAGSFFPSILETLGRAAEAGGAPAQYVQTRRPMGTQPWAHIMSMAFVLTRQHPWEAG